MYWFLIPAGLAILYIFSLRCRKGHPDLENLRKYSYAHRGLHGNGLPENSLAAFRLASEKGYGSELDIHLLKDGQLAVIHDASLQRTAGADVQIEDLTAEDLEKYRLEGTEEKIPLFSQVLELYAGKQPLIVELKSERDNHAALCKAATALLDRYNGPYCIESFDPACVAWLRNNRPDLVRGQLSANFFLSKKSKLPIPAKWAMTTMILNFRSCPDFVAYKFQDRKRLGLCICRRLWGAQGVTWTIKSQEEYDTAVQEGWIPIFEGFEP